MFFPLGKISAVLEDCTDRCAGDSECSDSGDLICTADHGYSGIPKMCCRAPCDPTLPSPGDCPDEIFYDSEGAERPRYCLEEGRCARNGDPPPPAPAVGDCTIDENCRSAFPDRPYCLLRPGHIEGNACVRCMEDSQCPPGQYCTPGRSCEVRSERNCCYDSDCPSANEVCWDETTSLCTLGHCCKATEGCASDADCQGRRCIPGVPSHCEKSSLPPAAGSVAEGGRCAKASECSGRFGCLSTGTSCEGRCGICTTNEDCFRKGAGQCRPDESGAGMCGAEAGVSCATNEDCERIHSLPGFECRGGICEPPTTPTAPTTPAPYVYRVIQPELQIPLPTLAGLTKFLPVKIEGAAPDQYIIIPWIGEYIAAIYKYAIGITGILAGIMTVIAGLIWLMAGGSAEKVSAAKSYIEGAFVGLVIALTSYILLYAINPKLTEFDSLKIKLIQREELSGQPTVMLIDEQGNVTERTGEATEGVTVEEQTVTSVSPASCTILFFTDTHDNPACMSGVIPYMLNESNVDIIIHGGDMIDKERRTADELRRLWQSQWDRPTETLRAKWPDKRAGSDNQKFYATIGNHDDPTKFTERFGGLPKKVSCGNVDFFILHYRGTNTSWLKNQITTSTARWKVVVQHVPLHYSCLGGHSVNRSPTKEDMQGINLVLTGDSHVYCEGEKDGIRYLIGGTAGQKFRSCADPQLPICDDEIKQSYFRIEFGGTINLQRKAVDPVSGCRTYRAGG